MERVPTLVEFLLAGLMLGLGLLMFFQGTLNNRSTESAGLLFGAFLLVFGATILGFAVKAMLKHRQSLRGE